MLTQDEKHDLTKATIKGTMWSYASKYSGKFMVFISTVILARLLSQEDYGVAGYALVVISFLEVMQGIGIGPALIYYDEEPERSDTGFWLGIGMSLFLFGLTWLIAPLAGVYFQDPRAVEVTRVLAFTFPLSSLNIVPDALTRKQLAFGIRMVPDIGRAVGKGLISILFAVLGFGYWSLIIGQLGGVLAAVISFWWISNWRPRFRFNRAYVKSLLFYGSNIVVVDALGIILLNMDYLLIGRFLGAAALGVYTLAFRVPDLLINQFCVMIARVVFPTYTKMRGDLQALQHSFLQTMRYVSLITVPLSFGLILIARPFIIVAFTAKWEEAIPVLVPIATYTLLRSFIFNIGDVYKAQGRPSLLTKLSFVQAIIFVPALYWAVTVPQTIIAVGWVQAATSFVAVVINFIVASRMLHTSIFRMLDALRPALTSGVIMGVAVMGVLYVTPTMNPWMQLISTVATGGVAYLTSLWFLQKDIVMKLVTTFRLALLEK